MQTLRTGTDDIHIVYKRKFLCKFRTLVMLEDPLVHHEEVSSASDSDVVTTLLF